MYSMSPIIHASKTPEDLANAFALHLISWINETAGDTFHLALSGGKTPALLFTILAEKYAAEIPWHKVHFWWGDERMVSSDDPESNFGVANQLLFSWIELPHTNIHEIRGDADPVREAKRYGSDIKRLIPVSNNWPVFDLIMLGLGEDGHTASIFPDHMPLLESEEITVVAFHPVTGQQRITITGKVINQAKRVAFLVTGASKAAILDEIFHRSKSAASYPASHIHPVRELHWFVDDTAYKATANTSATPGIS